jgi:hypothetical protein
VACKKGETYLKRQVSLANRARHVLSFYTHFLLPTQATVVDVNLYSVNQKKMENSTVDFKGQRLLHSEMWHCQRHRKHNMGLAAGTGVQAVTAYFKFDV